MTDTLALDADLAARRQTTVPPAAAAVAVCSLVGAAIHLWVVPEHLEEWWLFAAFFVAVAVGQLLSGLMVLLWPRPRLLVAALLGNVAVVLVWVFSRTTGLPVGPPVTDMTGGLADPELGGYGSHAENVEAVGALDLTASGLELLVVFALASLLPPRLRYNTVNGLMLAGLALWSIYLLGFHPH